MYYTISKGNVVQKVLYNGYLHYTHLQHNQYDGEDKILPRTKNNTRITSKYNLSNKYFHCIRNIKLK